ncbi:hypothetical protein Lal_00041741 [Lupinus albus]|nr:hypothetical protein Lal_00041741 [Lupinus albus]
MVERWRPETHTFHFPNGECTITLEDVAYQLDLPIDGKSITGDTSMDWGDLCLQLLGGAPIDKQINGQRVQHTWLESIYQQLPDDADDEVVEQHARAFILRMIGEFLMPNTSRSRFHLMYLPLLDDLSETFDYSWGSVVLACLYRGLCRADVFKDQKEVGGCLLLLQSWAYDHIQILAPMLHDNTLRYFPLEVATSYHHQHSWACSQPHSCEEDLDPDLDTVLMKTPTSQKEERKKTYKDYRRQSFKELESKS